MKKRHSYLLGLFSTLLVFFVVGCSDNTQSPKKEENMSYISLSEASQNPEIVKALKIEEKELGSFAEVVNDYPNVNRVLVFRGGWATWPPLEGDPNNSISNSLDFKALNSLESLKYLCITGIPLKTTPEPISKMENLELLQISLYLPDDLEQEIRVLKKVTSLRYLDLSNSVFKPGQQEEIITAFPEIEISPSNIQGMQP